MAQGGICEVPGFRKNERVRFEVLGGIQQSGLARRCCGRRDELQLEQVAHGLATSDEKDAKQIAHGPHCSSLRAREPAADAVGRFPKVLQ